MKISWTWLSSLVDTEGLSPEEVAEALTMAGLEVEGVEPFGQDPALDTVVVAHITSIEPHPQADKLVVCQVDAGAKGAFQIVCGAKNMKAGDKVPMATVGTVMPSRKEDEEPFVIREAELRGVKSSGMLCSAAELMLSTDHAGLMILPEDAPVGEPVLQAMGLQDTVLEVSLTPNRPDGLGHVGIAREVAALLGRSLRLPTSVQGWRAQCRGEEPPTSEPRAVQAGPPVGELLQVRLEDPEGCPRYMAAVLTDVHVGPSPWWMQARLMAIGQRPINNLVDVTNYVAHECGQPMHAFDLDQLAQQTIVIRRAVEGETLVTIDDKERPLTPEDVVIADAERPVAVAGVMGGAESGVTEATTRVALECAYFAPTRVRRTSRRLGLHTDSSHRFERGTDPNGVPWFMERAIDLLLETQEASAQQVSLAVGTLDAYPQPITPREVTLTAARYQGLIGVALSAAEMAETLGLIDIPAVVEGDSIRATVPTFRPDIERHVDLIEEIARVRGFETIEAELPMGSMGFAHTIREDAEGLAETVVPRDHEQALAEMRSLMLDRGLHEAVNYNFIASGQVEQMGFGENDPRAYPIKVRNPLADNMGVMRTTLVPGLLANIARNTSHQMADVALFEVGQVYLRHDLDNAPLPVSVGGERWDLHAEPAMLAALVRGQIEDHFLGRRAWDIFDVRGLVQDLVERVTRLPLTVASLEHPPAMLHPYACGALEVSGVAVGWLGALHPDLIKAHKVSGEVYGFELDVSRLMALRQDLPRMAAIPRFIRRA
ncbi:MAG: phenylalanine--tRNA ligase subunit beta [Myxococcota bacterium]